ncbi:hypothetical protein ACWDZX_16745, partial [Streptomyces collinus]
SAMTHGRGPQAPAILESLASALRTIDPDNAAVHADALAQAVEEMSLYLEDLHTRRRRELADEHTGDTAVRVRIRETAPVIELLATIADTLPEPGSAPSAAP